MNFKLASERHAYRQGWITPVACVAGQCERLRTPCRTLEDAARQADGQFELPSSGSVEPITSVVEEGVFFPGDSENAKRRAHDLLYVSTGSSGR